MRPVLPAVCQVMRCVKDATVIRPTIVADMLAEVTMCAEHDEALRQWLEAQLGVPVGDPAGSGEGTTDSAVLAGGDRDATGAAAPAQASPASPASTEAMRSGSGQGTG